MCTNSNNTQFTHKFTIYKSLHIYLYLSLPRQVSIAFLIFSIHAGRLINHPTVSPTVLLVYPTSILQISLT